MDQRRQRVMIETDRHRITGAITMPDSGFRSRLSDWLNHSERDFIAVTDAVVEPLGPDGSIGGAEDSAFVVVGRRHIVLAAPEGDAAVEDNGAAEDD